ncbi:MAG: hypothetical protein ACT4RN_16205 [Pseudonocardia sp.]
MLARGRPAEDRERVLAVHCPRHGCRVLLSPERIRALHNTPDGIVLEIECTDGAEIVAVTGHAVCAGAAVDRFAHRTRALIAALGVGL